MRHHSPLSARNSGRLWVVWALLCAGAGFSGCGKPAEQNATATAPVAEAVSGNFSGVWTSDGLSRVLVLNPDKTYVLCARKEGAFASGFVYSVARGNYTVGAKQLELSTSGGVLAVAIAQGQVGEKLVITETAAATIMHQELLRRKASDVSLLAAPGATQRGQTSGTVTFVAEGIEPLEVQYERRPSGALPSYTLKTKGRGELNLHLIEGGAASHLGLVVSAQLGKAFLTELQKQSEAERTVIIARPPATLPGETPSPSSLLRLSVVNTGGGLAVREITSP
jgi:hypothetical protein